MADNPLAPWRDAALVLLVLQALVLGLLPCVAVYFCTRGMRWLLEHTRIALGWVNDKARDAASLTGVAAGRVVAPIVAGEGWLAGAQATLRGLVRRFAPRRHGRWESPPGAD